MNPSTSICLKSASFLTYHHTYARSPPSQDRAVGACRQALLMRCLASLTPSVEAVPRPNGHH